MGLMRVSCDRCGQPYGFELSVEFGALDAPENAKLLLELKGWFIKVGADGSISEAICPPCILKEAGEVAEEYRGDWDL